MNKEYMKNYMAEYRKKNPDKVKIYRDRWATSNSEKFRDIRKDWKIKNPNKVKEMNKRYWFDRYIINSYKNPIRILKIKSRSKANYKISISGELCNRCKEQPATQRHHIDYNKPYEIEPLCNQCHANIHKQEILI